MKVYGVNCNSGTVHASAQPIADYPGERTFPCDACGERFPLRMRIDSAMLRECDAVYLLPGWMQSDGVARELGYADTMRKKIVFYREELVDHG